MIVCRFKGRVIPTAENTLTVTSEDVNGREVKIEIPGPIVRTFTHDKDLYSVDINGQQLNFAFVRTKEDNPDKCWLLMVVENEIKYLKLPIFEWLSTTVTNHPYNRVITQ